MKLYVKKNIKEKMKFIKSEYAKSVYIALLMRSRGLSSDMDEMYITLNEICYILTGEFYSGEKQWKRKMKSGLKKAIEELDGGVIEILNETKEEYIINAIDLLYIEQEDVLDTRTGREKIKNNDKFEIIDSDLITRYYNNFGVKGINFLFDYLYEINTDAYFMCARDEVNNKFNIDIKTFDKYIDFLEQERIIYVYRYSCRYANSGKTPKNMYGMNNEYVVNKVNNDAEKHMKEHEMTKGVVVKGKTKAELSSKKENMEQWLDMLEQAYIDDKPIIIKRGFYNKKGERITTKKRVIVEPQNKPQSTIQVKPKSCEHNIIQLNVSQNSDTESLTFNERLEHYKEIGELF